MKTRYKTPTKTVRTKLPDGLSRVELLKQGDGWRLTFDGHTLPPWVRQLARNLDMELHDRKPAIDSAAPIRVITIEQPPLFKASLDDEVARTRGKHAAQRIDSWKRRADRRGIST